MTATSRFKAEQPIAHAREDWLVALVGLRHSLGPIAKGILQRCQLRAFELPDLPEACRVLETITPDAIVLDSHHPDLQDASAAAVSLLRILKMHHDERPRIPLVVLTSSGIKALRPTFVRAGAVLLPVHSQTYREIATVIRQLCGLPAGCCDVGYFPQQTL